MWAIVIIDDLLYILSSFNSKGSLLYTHIDGKRCCGNASLFCMVQKLAATVCYDIVSDMYSVLVSKKELIHQNQIIEVMYSSI